MTYETTSSKRALTFTYICPVYQHGYKEGIDFRKKKEVLDPNYDTDRNHYCLRDEVFRDYLIEIRSGFTKMAELSKKFKEREDNKHIYDDVKEIKKPKIAEIAPLLQPTLEKACYIEFSLDKPEIGRDVFVALTPNLIAVTMIVRRIWRK